MSESTLVHPAPSDRPRRKKGSLGRTLAPLVVIALLLLLLLVGLGAYLLLSGSGRPQLGPQVSIDTPAGGSQASLNHALPIHATAISGVALTRLELYADGALVAAQDSQSPDGSSPLALNQTWTPLTGGRHVLLARAYTHSGEHADSTLVTVDVGALLNATGRVTISQDANGATPSINDIAQATGSTPDDIIGANPPLAGADPGAPLPPGTDVHLPPPPSPPAPPSPGAPPAPLPGTPAAPTGLAVTADCTSRHLTWMDNTGDETSFVVYRLEGPSMTHIATLPANSTSYADTMIGFGEFRYEVAAARGGLEGLSAVVSATTPGTCVPPEVAPTVVLSLVKLTTTDSWDGVFCYFNINGEGFQRYPLADSSYFAAEADGLTYDLARQLPDHGQFTLGVPVSGSVTLVSECWGRRGFEVLPIGDRFSVSHTSSDFDGSDRTQMASTGGVTRFARTLHDTQADTGRNLSLLYRLGVDTEDSRHHMLPDIEASISLIPDIHILFGGDILPPPDHLRIANGLDGCWMYPDARSQGACVLGGLFAGGWPTLYWDWTGNHTFTESGLRGFWITGWATDIRTGTRVAVVFPSRFLPVPADRRTLIVPATGFCGQRITFQVQAVTNTGLMSTPSEEISYDAPPCAGTVRYTIEFNDFRVARFPATLDWHNGEIEDLNGDFCFLCTDRRLELYGHFWVNQIGFVTGNFGGDIFAPCPRAAWCVGRGDNPLIGMPLIRVTPGHDIPYPSGNVQEIIIPYPGAPLPHHPNTNGTTGINRFTLDQGLGQDIVVSWSVEEVDQDHTAISVSGVPLVWCGGSMVIPAPLRAENLTDWHYHTLYNLHPENWDDPGPEGTCAISLAISSRMVP